MLGISNGRFCMNATSAVQLKGNGSIAKRNMCWLCCVTLGVGLSLSYSIVIMGMEIPYGVQYFVLALRYRFDAGRGVILSNSI